ncbi:integron integrase [soil metagenome]
MNNQNPTLEFVRRVIRKRGLSHKTENAYLNHIRRFLEFCGDGDISAERAAKVAKFLAQFEKIAADSTRNQAHSALLFLYRGVLGQKLSRRFDEIGRIRPTVMRREVFTQHEVRAVLKNLRGGCLLIAALMYGSGLRLAEVLRLRVRDLDFTQKEIIVRETRTGVVERTTFLPASLEKILRRHLVQVTYVHDEDCLAGYGKTNLPVGVRRKYPLAEREFDWQFLFPAAKLTSAENGLTRLHLSESTVQKAVADAVEKAGLEKTGSCQTLRYSFASRLYQHRCDIHSISRLLGHKSIKTTLMYLNTEKVPVIRSPLD